MSAQGSARGDFIFRPAVKADKAGVLAITPDIFDGIDYIDWQFDVLVDSPVYYPWVCVHSPTGKIASFAFCHASDSGKGPGAGAISLCGGRTLREFRNQRLSNIIMYHMMEQASGGRSSSIPAFLTVYNSPNYLAESFDRASQPGGQKSLIRGKVVLHHSCLAFEMTPSLCRQLRLAAEAATAETSTFKVASPAELLAAEPAASVAGVGLGADNYIVICGEASVATPNALVRHGHWVKSALASRQPDGSRWLAGFSVAGHYTCRAGVAMIINTYTRDEAATAEHIIEQLRRFLIEQQCDGAEVMEKILVSTFFPHSQCFNEVLSRIHLSEWLGEGRLPLSNLASAFCTLRVTRTELRDGDGGRNWADRLGASL